jgi:threonine synthase
MWKYWRRLPVAAPNQIVSLDEGGTPLLASRVSRSVWFKDETRNPTGSHKDRALAVAVSHARSLGRHVSVVVSAGSTGIANAAACARAGIQAVVVVGRGVPDERLYPAFALGARVIELDTDVDTVVERVAELGASGEVYVSSTARTSNPYQAEGAKTIAYEVADQLMGVPDWLIVPVGGGGTAAAIWRGFRELYELGHIQRLPRLLGVVAAGYDAIARALEEGLDDPGTVFVPGYDPPPTVLVKIAHVYPPDGLESLRAIRDSRGSAIAVSDADALRAQRDVAAREGLFVEPSSAAAVAAFEKARASGMIGPCARVVVLLSGSGFRETFISSRYQPVERTATSLSEARLLLAGLEQGVAA